MRSGPLLAAVLGLGGCGSTDATAVPIAGGGTGIGFDDLRYSSSLGAVLVPAGRAGVLALVAPDSLQVDTISGFSASDSFDGSHDFGATSVDEGHGLLFVTDRTSQNLHVVDPVARAIVASVGLAAGPDYVRYVSSTDEVWVTEPGASQIEVFSVAQMTPVASTRIPITNGPESLVIEQGAGRAYTHRWQSSTVVIDVRTHAAVAEWPNGCAASRGLAIDESRGLFFASCWEGTTSVLDVSRGGRLVGTMARGAGYDVIGYSPSLGHLYLAGTACRCLAVEGVSGAGELSFLGRFDAPGGSHCAVADDRGNAWVCDPAGGQLWRVHDPYPPSF
jgi:hypothetical protein